MPSLLAERTEPALNPRQEASAGVKHVSKYRSTVARWSRGLIGVLLLAAVWELAPRLEIVPSYVVSPLSEVLDAWWELIHSGHIVEHLAASLQRSVVGFALAVVTAIPLGAAIAWYRPVREIFTPVLEIFRNTAALAILPVFILVFGIGETSKVAIILFACFFPMLLSSITGVATVDQQLLRSAKVLGLSPVTTFRKVVFPAAVPTIFTGIRMAGAGSILVLIAAEMIGATKGVGFLITYYQNNALYPQMYAAILTSTALGLVVNHGLVALEKRLSRWRA